MIKQCYIYYRSKNILELIADMTVATFNRLIGGFIITRKIIAFKSSSGVFHGRYESVKDAAEKTKSDVSQIVKCAKNKIRQTNGFVFKYEEKVVN